MHLAYIILTHKYPSHLLRMVERLNHRDDAFFIHVDSKFDQTPFINMLSKINANVNFVKARENGRWGGIGIVKATINCITEVVHNHIQYDHIILLSGQDYPIKPLELIRGFYKENIGQCFISYQALPVEGINYNGYDRINCYSFNIGKRRETYIPFNWGNSFNLKGKILNFFMFLRCVFLPARKFPKELTPYYGSQWWSMNKVTYEKILEYLNNNPQYLKYHKHTLLPDEIFFQSLVLNICDSKSVINNNFRFIEWDKNSNHPKTIDETFFDAIQGSECLFARKFEENSEILNLIDKKIR